MPSNPNKIRVAGSCGSSGSCVSCVQELCRILFHPGCRGPAVPPTCQGALMEKGLTSVNILCHFMVGRMEGKAISDLQGFSAKNAHKTPVCQKWEHYQ